MTSQEAMLRLRPSAIPTPVGSAASLLGPHSLWASQGHTLTPVVIQFPPNCLSPIWTAALGVRALWAHVPGSAHRKCLLVSVHQDSGDAALTAYCVTRDSTPSEKTLLPPRLPSFQLLGQPKLSYPHRAAQGPRGRGGSTAPAGPSGLWWGAGWGWGG